MSNEVRVRFAPSPTGPFHIGGARSALFNWLLARKTGGKLILRIEDTDLERSSRESEENIKAALKWLGMDWDEGIDVGGPYGPYRQTERLDLYKKYTEQLLAEGKAYYCYCTDEELEEERQALIKEGKMPRYMGKCRDLTPEQIAAYEAEGRKPTVRFRVPADQQILVRDLVRGDVVFDSNGIGDFVIVKSDGIPTYNYAVVIDDASMKISHVIRAEEHLSNTPRQCLIYTPDHLDRYGHDMQNYVDAKFRILQNQTQEDAFIFWNDDPIIQRELHKYGIHGHYYPFAEKKDGTTAAYVEDKQLHFTQPIAFNMEQEELALTGKHNLFNSMAAGISANLAGIRKECIREALNDFEGVEHRLEKVCRVRGVDYINDSKATNVNSCWYALQSMKTKTILILGGKDKGNDYTEIADLVKEKCTGLVYMGLHNEKLHDFFDGFGLPVADVQSMEDAVDAAYKMAKKGETVLLSPCCASFDLFKSYEDRGEQFKKCVRNL